MKKFLQGLVEWSTRERPNVPYKDMGGIVSRNFRTWMGHSEVALASVAIGKGLALLTDLFVPILSVGIRIAMTLGPIVYYEKREFGFFGLFGTTGDYHLAEKQKTTKMKRNKHVDSLGDFISPLFCGLFSAMNFSVVGSGIAALLMLGAMVLLKRVDDS